MHFVHASKLATLFLLSVSYLYYKRSCTTWIAADLLTSSELCSYARLHTCLGVGDTDYVERVTYLSIPMLPLRRSNKSKIVYDDVPVLLPKFMLLLAFSEQLFISPKPLLAQLATMFGSDFRHQRFPLWRLLIIITILYFRPEGTEIHSVHCKKKENWHYLHNTLTHIWYNSKVVYTSL